MKILGIIPARGGSKGIPRKNIKLLCGKPLIQYTIDEAIKSNLDKIIVSTEDLEIKNIVEELGIEVVLRDDKLACDYTKTKDVLLSVIEKLDEQFDAVMTLQPTSPFRTVTHINESIELFNQDKEADSLVSIVDVAHNMIPESIMEKDKYGYLESFLEHEHINLRRQDKPKYYARNGAAVYITKIDKLKEFIFGGKLIGYPMNKIESIDLDDMQDWKIAEAILKNQ